MTCLLSRWWNACNITNKLKFSPQNRPLSIQNSLYGALTTMFQATRTRVETRVKLDVRNPIMKKLFEPRGCMWLCRMLPALFWGLQIYSWILPSPHTHRCFYDAPFLNVACLATMFLYIPFVLFALPMLLFEGEYKAYPFPKPFWTKRGDGVYLLHFSLVGCQQYHQQAQI